MGGGSSRGAEAFKQRAPISTPGIGDGIEGNRKTGGGEWYDPLPKENKGIFGSGINGEEFVSMLTRAAALAQGDYSAAAQIGQLMGRDKRQAADTARELDVYDKKQQIEQKYAKPANPYRFQDNAGNQMELDPVTGQVKPIFIDPSDRLFMANGGTVKVPNALRQRKQSGGLPEGYDSNEWEPVPGPQAPPPRTGAPQQGPATLSPEQWQATVQALGPEKANAWLRRGNIRIGGR